MRSPCQHSLGGLPSHASGWDSKQVTDHRADVNIGVTTLIGWGQHGSGRTVGCVLGRLNARMTRTGTELPCRWLIKRGVDLGDVSIRQSASWPCRGVNGERWPHRIRRGGKVRRVLRHIPQRPGKSRGDWGTRIRRTRTLRTGVESGLALLLLTHALIHLGRRKCWLTLVRGRCPTNPTLVWGPVTGSLWLLLGLCG